MPGRTPLAAVLILIVVAAGACSVEQGSLTATETTAAEDASDTSSTTTRAPSATAAPPTTTTTTTKPPSDPVIVDQGIWNEGGGDGGYVIILENPNPDLVISDVGVDVGLIDATNRLLDTDFGFVSFLLPGGKTAITGSTFDLPEPIAELEIDASWDTQKVEIGETVGDWVITDIAVVRDGDDADVTGDVTSTFESDFEDVEVVVVYLNEDSEIVFADFDYVSTVTADRTAFFDVTSFDVPSFATVEAYVVP
jgi:hypothetical protein